ncbi:MAG: NfeD family protein [Planctomycetota bacterium]
MNIYIWPTLLLIGALLMVFLEVFIPSAGLIPLMALGLAGTSLWSAFQVSYLTGLVFLMIELALMPIVVLLAAMLWPHTPMARFFMLKPPGQSDHPSTYNDQNGYQSDLLALIGQVGFAMTDLKPGGTVEVANQPLDALTDEGFIKAETAVKVVGTRQSQLLVRSYIIKG